MELRDKMQARYGNVGYVLYYILAYPLQLVPLSILGAPFHFLACLFFLLFFAMAPPIRLLYIGVWIWAFVVAVIEPFTVWTVLFFLAFACHAVFTFGRFRFGDVDDYWGSDAVKVIIAVVWVVLGLVVAVAGESLPVVVYQILKFLVTYGFLGGLIIYGVIYLCRCYLF